MISNQRSIPRTSNILIVVGLLLSISTIMVSASDFVIKKTSTPPTLDGIPDSLWTGVDSVTVENVYVAAPDSTEDFSATVKSVWDDNYIYFLFDLNDDVYVDDSPQGSAWQDDGVQIYLDPNNSKSNPYDANDANLLIRRNDSRPLEGAVPSSLAASGAVRWYTNDRVGGYSLEVAIAWSSTGITPTNGTLFGLDYQVNDDDGGNPDSVMKWFDTVGNGYANTAVFAEAELSDELISPLADVTILRTNSPVVIDGSPDPIWDAVDEWTLNQVYVASPPIDPANCSATVKALWDDTYLYYLFEVNDDIYVDDSNEGSAWQDDSVQIYFDGDNSKGSSYDANDDALILRRNDTKPIEGNLSKSYAANISWATEEGNGSYTVEVAIDWTAFGFTPTADVLFGLDFQVNDDDGGNPDIALKLFDQVGNGYANPAVFGTAVLSNNIAVDNGGGNYLGYPVTDGWIDADDWIGLLFVEYAPWVWSAASGNWIYIQENSVNLSGGWVYFIP